MKSLPNSIGVADSKAFLSSAMNCREGFSFCNSFLVPYACVCYQELIIGEESVQHNTGPLQMIQCNSKNLLMQV